MDTEYNAQVSNNTWTVTKLPVHKKPVAYKWVFKVKLRADGSEERKKACIVAKGFTRSIVKLVIRLEVIIVSYMKIVILW